MTHPKTPTLSSMDHGSFARLSAFVGLTLTSACFAPGDPAITPDTETDTDDISDGDDSVGATSGPSASAEGDASGTTTSGGDSGDSDDGSTSDSGDESTSGGSEVDCNGEVDGEAYIDGCGACVGGSTGQDECPSEQLVAIADARVVAASPDTNYGQEPTLTVDTDASATYLKFDISALPDEAVIRGGRLVMTSFDAVELDVDLQIAVHEVTDDSWEEEDITWNARPSPADDAAGQMVVNLGGVAQDTAISFESDEFTGLLQQAAFAGDDFISLALSSQVGSSWYHAREAGPSVAPRLELAYELGTIVTLDVDADGYVSNQAPDDNYGAEGSMTVEPENFGPSVSRMFMRFDLGEIPPGAEIYGARLRALAHSGLAYGGDGNVYTHVTDTSDWMEDGLTWNNQPTVSLEPLGQWWLWYNANPADREGWLTTRSLAAAIASALGDGQIGFRQHSPGYRTHYYTKESADAATHPWLSVLYIDPT